MLGRIRGEGPVDDRSDHADPFHSQVSPSSISKGGAVPGGSCQNDPPNITTTCRLASYTSAWPWRGAGPPTLCNVHVPPFQSQVSSRSPPPCVKGEPPNRTVRPRAASKAIAPPYVGPGSPV